MPTAMFTALVTSLLWIVPLDAPTIRQTGLELEFFDPFGRSSYQFAISEEAYVAVFEIRPGRVELTYPAIGDELRAVRYEGAESIAEQDNLFPAGRHLLPQRAGRIWSGRTENGFLLKGRHILVVASKKPFTFERLNGLFVDEGETLRRHNSFGAVEDFTNVLIQTITPGYAQGEWAAYLHWIRDE